MSISNLFEANEFNLFAQSVTFGGAPGATGAGQDAFDSYRQQALNFGATGAVSVGATGIIGLYRQLDRSYIMTVSNVSVTGSGVAGPIVLSPALPTNLWAPTPFVFPIWIEDGGVFSAGTCSIGSDGVITIYKNYNSNFTATGTCGFPTFSISFASFLT